MKPSKGINIEIRVYSGFKDVVLLKDLSSLYSAIFNSDIQPYVEQIRNYTNMIILLAYVNEIPAGFKIGYSLPEKDDVLYSWAGGTLSEYRGQGIASQLMELQHKKCTALGIKTIETKCRAKWTSMMSLNKRFGFELIEEYAGSCGTTKYLLRKQLDQIPS